MRNILIAGIVILTGLVLFSRFNRPQPKVEPSPQKEQSTVAPVTARTQAVQTTQAMQEVVVPVEAPVVWTNTPEAKQIEAVLAKHGWPTNALRDAYDYAYESRRVGGHIDDGSEGARFHIEGLLRHHRRRLEEHGQPNEDFFKDLLAIRPTVFTGQRSTGGEMPPLPKD